MLRGQKRSIVILVWIAMTAITIAFVVFCNLGNSAVISFWSSLSVQSSTLATWITALATVGLIYGIFVAKQSMNEYAQTAAFQRTYDQFNAPNLRHARAVFAKTHWGRVERGGIDKIKDNYLPQQGWQVVNLLNSIAHLVITDRIRFEDALFAYGQHVQLICSRWRHLLADECREGQFKPLLDLCAGIDASPQRFVRNDIEREFAPAQEAFWRSEAALDPSAKAEDDIEWPKE